MPDQNLTILPGVLALVAGAIALAASLVFSARRLTRARSEADALVLEGRREGESRAKEIAVAAREEALAFKEEADARDHEIDDREASLDARTRTLETQHREQARAGQQIERRTRELENRERAVVEAETSLSDRQDAAAQALERVAGLTRDQARAEVVAGIEQEARAEGLRIARKIEEEGRLNAEGEARKLVLQASQRVNIQDVMESTVTFIELPSDEMKGRIIGKEGRNIRALEMATGIDLIVDDTPRSIWISSFDPMRREIARIAIDRLLEDGRIHPARIEEAVSQVSEEIEKIIDERGQDAAFTLGITDISAKLTTLLGKMRYHTTHGQNLLQHSMETAMIAGFMAQEMGARVDVVQRAGLLHEVGQVAPNNGSIHPTLFSADVCERHRESAEVAQTIRCLHPDVQPKSIEGQLLTIANRLSESRPGARKENLAVFIERLKRLEGIAERFEGVRRAYAVKAGKELRVLLDAEKTSDDKAFALSKEIARAIERELSYPGQIKVNVVRQTRSIRFAV